MMSVLLFLALLPVAQMSDAAVAATTDLVAPHFFLGGRDLEMLTIRQLLQDCSQPFSDAGCNWGAAASQYRDEIERVLQNSGQPVLVELKLDLPSELLQRCRIVDHHDKQAGSNAATSLEQIFRLLQLPAARWSRHFALVAANDRGHLREMRTLQPAPTDSELLQIRLDDLTAQGSSAEELAAAAVIVRSALQTYADGRLTVVDTEIRSTLAAEVLEPLHGGPGFQNLLVRGSQEYGFCGDGPLVEALQHASPQDSLNVWSGGALPAFGYWGGKRSAVEFDPLELLLSRLAD